ncbi:MAG: GMC oxidoreductase, partial [Mycobacterium sp.]
AEHRVFGVERLYVVDGSTMPTQGSANPALTIMALAARAADLMVDHAAARTRGVEQSRSRP